MSFPKYERPTFERKNCGLKEFLADGRTPSKTFLKSPWIDRYTSVCRFMSGVAHQEVLSFHKPERTKSDHLPRSVTLTHASHTYDCQRRPINMAAGVGKEEPSRLAPTDNGIDNPSSSLMTSPTATTAGLKGGATSCFCFPSSSRKKSIEFLIAKRRWTALASRLESLEPEEHESAMNFQNTQETILSLLCRFAPPETILEQVTELFPAAVQKKNANNQYPLHIASSYGASPAVISHLCNLYPEAAGRVDNLGRTPLHLACSDYCNSYKICRKSLISLDEAIYQVIRELIRASPKTVTQEDYDNTSALEYGISANVDIRVINSIQKACERFYKSQSEKLKLVDPLIPPVSLNSISSTHVSHSSLSNAGRMQKEKQTSMTNDSVETAISSDGQLHSPIHTKEDDGDGDPSSEDSHATPIQDDPNESLSSVPTRISLDEMRRFLDNQQEELQA